jgi:hypothetical protein
MPWLLEIVYIRDVRIYVSNRLELLLGMGCPPQKLVTVSWNAGNFSLYPSLGSAIRRRLISFDTEQTSDGIR